MADLTSLSGQRPGEEKRNCKTLRPTGHSTRSPLSLSQDRLEPEPERTDCAGDDSRDYGFHRVALHLLRALAPAAQIGEVRPYFLVVAFLNAEQIKKASYFLRNGL